MSDATSNRPQQVTVPRAFLCGAARGCGTSTITIGILAALKRAGMTAACGLMGSRLIQATHYRRVTGTLTHSLNAWMLDREQLTQSIARVSGGAEVVLIEGEQALFDDYPHDFSVASDAEAAVYLGAPVILIVDAQSLERTIAALVHGYTTYHPQVRIAAIIANRVRDKQHTERLREAVESLGGPVFLGGVPDDSRLQDIFQPADPANPSLLSRSGVIAAAEIVQKYVDIERLRAIAAECLPLDIPRHVLSQKSRVCKIAVADDMAFHVTFQSNLDLLRREGAELVAFSPVVDRKLPAGIRGVYLPGGYVHLYASELSANQAMLEALRAHAKSGGALFAEGNSLGYLCQTAVISSGTRLAMVGLVPGNATLLTERTEPDRSAYIEVRSTASTVISRKGERFRGHRDYQWSVRLESAIPTSFELNFRNRDDGAETLPPIVEGLCPMPNVLVTSVQPHWASNPVIARIFLQNAQGAVQNQPAQDGDEPI